MSQIQLSVFTPEGKKFDSAVDFVQIHGDKYFLGILPNHAPLISDVIVSKMIIRINGEDVLAAIGAGVCSIENNIVKVVADSFELASDIDEARALQAKERAEKRLENPDDDIDIARAKAALSRALNRLAVLGK